MRRILIIALGSLLLLFSGCDWFAGDDVVELVPGEPVHETAGWVLWRNLVRGV